MGPRMYTQPAQAVAKEDTKITLEEVAIATQQRYDAGRFAPRNANELWDLAEKWYASDLLPDHFYPPVRGPNRPHGLPKEARYQPGWRKRGVSRAVIVMRYGASLGVLPEAAVNGIAVVEGRPSPTAGLMLSLCISSGALPRDDFEVVSTDTECTIRVFTRSRAKAEVVTVKYEEFKHLHKKTVWEQYPRDMLFARCVTRMTRRYFPDLVAGVYCAEERHDMREDGLAGLGTQTSADAILAAVSDEPPTELPPDVANEQAEGTYEPGSLAEQEALVSEVAKLIAELPADAAPDDPRRATIKEKGERIQGSQRAVLAAAYDAKCRKAPSRG